MDARFKLDDIVQRVNQPEINGIVIGKSWDDQTETWTYQVQFNGTVSAVPETSLRGWKRTSTVWEKLRNFEFSGIDHFRDTLTFHKVKSPTARIAHAYSSARTLFFPHQFKPLLKFLDGGGNGMLIADDVGLGKTIEAGYILRELSARKTLERVLVLAPARLATKWKREMAQRFEESFEIAKGSNLIDLSKAIEAGREVGPFRWIISYEGSRSEDVQTALESAQPALDLLIVDEAHRLRNSSTLQHKLGKLLCNLSDHRIFLTATPVQNSLRDLWNLLRLLSEDEFPDEELFKRQVEANRRILECQGHLTTHPPRVNDALASLKPLQDAEFLGAPVPDHFIDSIVSRLQQNILNREEVAELNIDLAQLNTLGHIISRTRKSEAMPGCARRVASWVSVKFSEAERNIYDSVEELCRANHINYSGIAWGVQMANLMAYRITASCIPAAIRYFEERFKSPEVDNFAAGDDYFDSDESGIDGESAKPIDSSNWIYSQRDTLTELVTYWSANGKVDSKFKALDEVLIRIWEEDERSGKPRRKIVLFSFFRKTLEYLRESLLARNYSVRMIHGLLGLQDRERAIEEFLTQSDIEILLTSEVGGEGIDLQKASVVLNYDLPWNPMVVEQRIGRIDRIGQEAQKIIIVNFVVEQSIEERILQRLLNKIGIFENSIGEIDPIIGDQMEKLSREMVSGLLTDDELEKKLIVEEQAIANRTIAARKVQDQAEYLLTTDQSLLDEIGALTGEQQVPGEADLWRFLNRFLGQTYPGYLIPEDALKRVERFKLSPKLASDMDDASVHLGSNISYFAKKIAAGEIIATLARDVAYRHTTSELIHFGHPLVKFAVWKLTGRFGNEAFSLSLDRSTVLKQGLYGFAVRIIELDGPILRNKLQMAVVDVQRGGSSLDRTAVVTVLLEVLENGKSEGVKSLSDADIDRFESRINLILDQFKNELDDREKKLASDRHDQRQAISVRLAELKVKRAMERHEQMKSSGAKDFALRMGDSKIKKAKDALASMHSREHKSSSFGVTSWTDVAVGFLRVGG